MTPEWGTSLHTLPPETQFLLLQLDGDAQQSSGSSGRYALVLPLIDGNYRATCRPNRWACGGCGAGERGGQSRGCCGGFETAAGGQGKTWVKISLGS